MKKKSLSLFLTMSCLTVVCLVLFTIVTVFPPKNNKNNPEKPVEEPISSAVNEGNNKGSKEDPYYIYDIETFNLLSEYGGKTKPVRKPVQEPDTVTEVDKEGYPEVVERKDENGNTVYKDKLDENGYVIYEEVEGEEEVNHFKFLRNIDFSGKNFVTIFSGEESFIGEIDGNGKSVKNVSINVTKANLDNYIYLGGEVGSSKLYSARIAILGSTNGAVIENITFDNVSVKVDKEVINYVSNGEFSNDHLNSAFNEFIVGSVIAYAEDTTLKANVSATVDSDAYSVYYKNKTNGINAIGGVIAYAKNTTITSYSETENANINVSVIADDGNRGYYVGGVAGYLYLGSTISNVTVNANIKTVSTVVESLVKDNILQIGGVAGIMRTANIENSIVNVEINQVENTHATIEISKEKPFDSDLYNHVGGLVSVIRANNNTQLSNIKNVKVTSNINMDALFGGVVYEVKSTNPLIAIETATEVNPEFVLFEDLIVSSNVNTIKAYGIAANLLYTRLNFTKYEEMSGTNAKYNIKLTGTTILDTKDGIDVEEEDKVKAAFIFCSNFANPSIKTGLPETPDGEKLKGFHLVYSESIGNKFDYTGKYVTIPALGSATQI